MKKILFKVLLFLSFMIFPVVTYALGGISVIPSSITVDVGSTKTFTIEARNTQGGVTLSSSDSNIAAININSWEIEDVKEGQTKTVTVTVTGVSAGTATITITIDAITFDEEQLNDTRTVTVTVRDVSSNNNLSSLKIDNVDVPNFSPSTTTYNIENINASINITATAEDSKATVTGTGTKTLKYGSNVYEVKVTAENGNVKTYKLNITRRDLRDTNNYLKSLSTSIGTINFNKDTLKYSITVESNVEKLIVTAEADSSKAKVTGTGEQTLKYGENKLEVKVTAENETLRTYVISVIRKDDRDNNNYLKNLSVDRGTINFSKTTLSYSITVPDDVEKITITAEADSEKAKVIGDGEKTLQTGDNKFEIKVTAENEEVKTYVINVKRLEKDTTKYIKSLTIEGSDIVFDPEITSYNITLGEEQTELNINYELEEEILASIEGNENLKNGSIVILKLTKGEKSKEYIFNIRKPVPMEETTTKVKPKYLKWIIIGGVVILLGIIGAFANKKKKNKKPAAEAEVPTLDDMSISLPETDTTIGLEEQSTTQVMDSNVPIDNNASLEQNNTMQDQSSETIDKLDV